MSNTETDNLGRMPVIVISCGGTGGHMQPGISVGKALRKQGLHVLFLVNQKKISEFFIRNLGTGYEVYPEFDFSKLVSLKAPLEIFKGILTVFKVLRLLFRYRVRMIVSAGSSSGIIPVLMMRLGGIPGALLEQNVVMGKANRFLLSSVKRAYLSYPCINIPESSKLAIVGNPLKESLLQKSLNRKEAALKLGLKENCFTVLFLGGSQGARAINGFALEIVPQMKEKRRDLQVIHITGKSLLKECREAYTQHKIPFFCEEFTDEMEAVYTLSDLSITRSGGGALAELSVYGIPAIYVPFPYAAEDHQKRNAQWAVKEGGALLFDEKEIATETVRGQILSLLENQAALEQMKKRQFEFARPRSTEDIVKDILAQVKQG